MDKFHDERPWGQYHVILKEPGHWVKRIEVKSGARLSYQYHQHRSEEWIIVYGNGSVTINDEKQDVRAGSHIHIGVGDKHRIENTGQTALVFIEVALGAKLTEDDIIRVEDDYGRK